MPTTSLADEARGLSAPLACQLTADVLQCETGALSGAHQWLSNGSITRDSNIGHRITGSSNRSCRPPVPPIASVLIALASLSLILSLISLALTCVAMTTTAKQRRVSAAGAGGLALYKQQARQTKEHSAIGQNEDLARGSVHKEDNKDTRTSLQQPLFSTSSRRLSKNKAPAIESVSCQCAELSLVAVEPPVAAHVSGTNSNITKWETENVSYKITCRNGRLVAPEDGLYAVYSQLYLFLYAEDETVSDSSASLCHSVVGRHPVHGESVEKEETLMERRWTQTWNKDSSVVEASSHLAGVFRLRSNDELGVRLSQSEKFQIHTDREMTYFGMFKIR